MTEFDRRMEDLAERTKQASERVRAAAGATKEKLQSQVLTARTSIEKTNRQFEEKAAGARDEASKRWAAARQRWNDHTAEIKRRADTQKAEHDLHRAERRAEWAEDDALAAIDFAYYAVQEAEYEVLDAALARAEANDMAAAQA
jgi:uncharacterized protein YgiM (DUF1202 family)